MHDSLWTLSDCQCMTDSISNVHRSDFSRLDVGHATYLPFAY